MAEQLALPLPTREALGRDDFYVSPVNQAAVAALDHWRDWPTGTMAIVGPEGSGKSHLAQVFSAMSGARVIHPGDLNSSSAAALAEGPVVLDDAEAIQDEPAAFHFFNQIRANDQALLVTARTPPARWPLTLPDLISRLSAVPVVHIEAPDDALLAAVLAKHFSDRGIAPPPTLIPYLVTRIERSLAAAATVVERIDSIAMADGAPIGTRLAARVLDNAPPTDA